MTTSENFHLINFEYLLLFTFPPRSSIAVSIHPPFNEQLTFIAFIPIPSFHTNITHQRPKPEARRVSKPDEPTRYTRTRPEQVETRSVVAGC